MLRQLQEGLWIIDHPLKLPGGVQIGTRTTIVRLADSGLFMHSPGPKDNTDAEAIAKLGNVAHIVAPNLFHHFYVKEALEQFGGAKLYAPPDFEKKVEGVPFETLTDAAPAAWANEMDQVAIQGAPKLNEVVFCHRPTRTLMLTDMCFNVRHSDSFITRTVMSLLGGYGHFGPSRLAKSFMKDKRAVRAGIDRILELDFDRVTVTHGEIVETGGKQGLRDAFASFA